MMMMLMLHFASAFVFVSGNRGIMKLEGPRLNDTQGHERSFVTIAVDFFWQPGASGYQHVWPVSSSFGTCC